MIRALHYLLATVLLAVEVMALAVFSAFVHIPSDLYRWNLVGKGLDPMNLHRILVSVPGALVMIGCATTLLTVAQARGSGRAVSQGLMRASLVLAPLLSLPVVLWYARYTGRIYVASALSALTGYLGWTLLEPWVSRWWRKVGPRISDPFSQKLYGALVALIVAVGFFLLGWARHRAMWSSLIDLGLFYQLFDTSRHALLYSPALGHSFLAEHFSPLLVVLWPLVRLLPSPVTLIGVQAASLGLGGYLLYLWARERTQHYPLALMITLLYLLSPLVQQAALYDFHMDLMEPPLIFGSMLALQRRRDWVFAGCCVLLWLTKEDTFLYTSVMALYAMVHQRRWVLGAVILVLGLLQGYLVAFHLLPHLRPLPDGLHFSTSVGGQGYAFIDRYASWGSSPGEILRSLVTSPHLVVKHIFTAGRLTSLLALVLGFGGLAVASRGRIFLLLPILEMLLSESYELSELKFYYGAVAITIAALPAVEGAAGLMERWRRSLPGWKMAGWSPARMTCALGVALGCILALHPKSYLSDHRQYPSFQQFAHHRRARLIMDSIDEQSRISANGYLAAQLMTRHHTRMFPFGLKDADMVLLDLQRPSWPMRYHNVQSMAHTLVAGGRFDAMRMEDGILLLVRDAQMTPSTHAERRAVQIFLDQVVVEAELTERTAYSNRVRSGEDASNGGFLRVGDSDARGPGHLLYGPFARMSGGTYLMKTRLRWKKDFIVPLVHWLPVVTVDVVRKSGLVAASRTLTVGDLTHQDGRWQEVTLQFEASRRDGEHEFRVFYHDLGSLDLDVVTIERIMP